MCTFLSRRGLLIGAFSLLMSSSAYAMIGIPIGKDVYKAVENFEYIQDGSSEKVIYVITSPWCPFSSDLYNITRDMVKNGDISFRWIPFSGGQEEGLAGLEKILSNPVSDNIPNMFMKIGEKVEYPSDMSRVYSYSKKFHDSIHMTIIENTSKSILTPTFIYRVGERVRIIPGMISKEKLQEISNYATK